MRNGSLVYDITRLTSRILSRTPNGIDRIDFALANHFLNLARPDRSGVLLTAFGPRVITPIAAREAVDAIRDHWGEDEAPESDPNFLKVQAVLHDVPRDGAPSPSRRISRQRGGRFAIARKWISRHGAPLGQAPGDFLAPGGAYINVSQYPLWSDRYFRWLKLRPDVRGVFFLHDLLPLQTPEYFVERETARFARRIETLARYGHAAIVSTQIMRDALKRRLAELGRAEMPILVAPLPVAPEFARRETVDGPRASKPYFLFCSTIEPRKNHLLILQVWRDLVGRMGEAAPLLVLVGERGWKNQNVIDLLERCPALQRHVIETSGLSTPGVKRLLAGARALLMPSFAEGYGLPVIEALASGIPVIASDIPTFREIGGDRFVALDPTDGPGWRDAIRVFAAENSPERKAAVAALADYRAPELEGFVASVENFILGL